MYGGKGEECVRERSECLQKREGECTCRGGEESVKNSGRECAGEGGEYI